MGDDRALNLLRAFIDLRDLSVAIEPLDLEAADVSGAAEDLHGVGGMDDRHVAGEAIRDRAAARALTHRAAMLIDNEQPANAAACDKAMKVEPWVEGNPEVLDMYDRAGVSSARTQH